MFGQSDPQIRSHCIVVSLTTSEPRTSVDVAYWIRTSMAKSGKAFNVMAGPAHAVRPGEFEAYALASLVASLPEDQIPISLHEARLKFLSAINTEPTT